MASDPSVCNLSFHNSSLQSRHRVHVSSSKHVESIHKFVTSFFNASNVIDYGLFMGKHCLWIRFFRFFYFFLFNDANLKKHCITFCRLICRIFLKSTNFDKSLLNNFLFGVWKSSSLQFLFIVMQTLHLDIFPNGKFFRSTPMGCGCDSLKGCGCDFDKWE